MYLQGRNVPNILDHYRQLAAFYTDLEPKILQSDNGTKQIILHGFRYYLQLYLQ